MSEYELSLITAKIDLVAQSVLKMAKIQEDMHMYLRDVAASTKEASAVLTRLEKGLREESE